MPLEEVCLEGGRCVVWGGRAGELLRLADWEVGRIVSWEGQLERA